MPDHIRIHQQERKDRKTIGIYLAPMIHSRNTDLMQGAMQAGETEAKLVCLSIEDFLLDMEKISSKEDLINQIKSFIKTKLSK